MNLRFAFAVDNNGDFQKKHFGDADKYIIYEHDSKELVFIDEIININRDLDEEHEHGSKKKGQAVIEYLKEMSVKVVVSMQFGKNIKMVDKHFIPIIVEKDNLEDITKIIESNINWINEEALRDKENYMLFRINKGIFKQQFNKYKNKTNNEN